uniref:Mevalonate kinase n=1 Tax=Arion vulgaris TaxID=1028688 RepID=A0A0B6ZXD7_9EUPU
MEICVSAPGKVILHGEHAVVYGKAAIAASLNLRCHLTVKTNTGSEVSLDLPDVKVHKKFLVTSMHNDLKNIDAGAVLDPSPASDEMIAALKKYAGIDAGNTETKYLAVIAFLYTYYNIFKDKSELPVISLHMKSELPVGAGLGSSAAFSVCMSASLLQLAGNIGSEKQENGTATWSDADKSIINKWAFIGEKVIHGRPSGIDNSVSTFGGALRFQNGKITLINQMPTLPVMLVNTKVPRSTMVLVAGLREKYNVYPEIFDAVFLAVEAITRKAEDIYKSLHDHYNPDDFSKLGDLIDLNHQMLNMMGVGHASLDHIVAVAKEHGFHSKLTGAGGGGCAFVLIPPDTVDDRLQDLRQELEQQGLEVWPNTSVGGHGVLQHL